jgi:hypothetical protein
MKAMGAFDATCVGSPAALTTTAPKLLPTVEGTVASCTLRTDSISKPASVSSRHLRLASSND